MTRKMSCVPVNRVGPMRLAVALVAVPTLTFALQSCAARDVPAVSIPTQRISAFATPEATLLEPGAVYERPLARGQEHRYQIALTKGEYIGLTVEQHGVDVVVETRGPDGVIADFQSELRPQGEERADLVADTSGLYTVAILPGEWTPPGAYAIRVAARRMATDADRSTQESRKLRTRAARVGHAGQLGEARLLFERALRISEEVLGPDDPYVIDLVLDLATNALDARDHGRSEALFLRALPVLDRAVGSDHPTTAIVRSRLALLYDRLGQHPKTDQLLQRALPVIEKTLGPEHPWFIRTLVTLGRLRQNVGDLERAEEIDRRGLATLERIQQTDSVLYAALLNNLGLICQERGDLATAEDLYVRSLVIGERLQGLESYGVSTSYQNLGIIARERKDYALAAAYYTRALSIREPIVGPDHPDDAQLLNNLAIVYHLTGDDARSLETHFRALRIWEKGGPYSRGILVSLGNIARLYAAGDDITNAVAFQRRVDAVLETQLALNLATGSERQKLAFAGGASERTDRTISLHLREAPENTEASALASLVLLQRKGRVLDAMTDTFAAARQQVADPGDRDLLDQLNATTTQLARLAVNAPDEAPSGERQKRIKELEARKERLEAQIGEHSAELRARMQPVTLDAVQAAMPDDGVLLEYAVYRPFDPKAERNAEAYGPSHYAVYIVPKHGAPVGRDLGAADVIDETIEALRLAVCDPSRTDLKERARALDERVMRPLRALFGNATRLLISPDGDLNLVPFEALIDEEGRYLIESYASSYLTSGRDLLRMQVKRRFRSNPVIVADPLFGEPASSEYSTPMDRSAGVSGRTVMIGDELSTMYFAPLGTTAEEARAIKALYPEATLLTGWRATKARLQELEAPRLLHIASHGFFLQDAAREAKHTMPAPPDGGARAARASINVENPLLRSGLALAGANLTRDQQNKGILTALEASGLNLWGTKLVTLSACDTGIGEVRNGEGVYGLRRAFVLAGTETLVMSLWPVSDYVSRETMVAYYTGLRAGLGRGDALRQAKLAMLKRKARQHPFYWASFIQSGDWTGLSVTR
jgi:CHAT domain-containing protein